MHFQNSESGNVVSQHNLIGTCCLVYALYDLKITVSEVEVASIDSHTPGMRQARHYSDTICSIWIAALNLEYQTIPYNNFFLPNHKCVRLELRVNAVETYHASACNSPIQLVLPDIHSEELDVI